VLLVLMEMIRWWWRDASRILLGPHWKRIGKRRRRRPREHHLFPLLLLLLHSVQLLPVVDKEAFVFRRHHRKRSIQDDVMIKVDFDDMPFESLLLDRDHGKHQRFGYEKKAFPERNDAMVQHFHQVVVRGRNRTGCWFR
jgi:hypothetical protein